MQASQKQGIGRTIYKILNFNKQQACQKPRLPAVQGVKMLVVCIYRQTTTRSKWKLTVYAKFVRDYP